MRGTVTQRQRVVRIVELIMEGQGGAGEVGEELGQQHQGAVIEESEGMRVEARRRSDRIVNQKEWT